MKTFSIQTLGCKVNQYESEQIATLLRRRGLVQVDADSPSAHVRIVNTCSVTVQAVSKSRQLLRRSLRLPVLDGARPALSAGGGRATKTIAAGCFATSDPVQAEKLGVDAVLTHHHDVAAELNRLLDQWDHEAGSEASATTRAGQSTQTTSEHLPKPRGYEGSITQAGTSASLNLNSRPHPAGSVKINPARAGTPALPVGTRSLPLLDARQPNQRAMLKIQDGCDAHCSYCIIPQLRPTLWSKPIADAVEEARRLVAAGHREIVLTGIFLGAYGQPTALRRRQPHATGKPLAALVEALCTQVGGLLRLRFSSLEPGDLTHDLLAVMRSHPQCVPHFHLPLQSGSDAILRRMNRQYTRDDFLRMIEDVHRAFDRPAITTDIIAGFPGETDDEFAQTLDIVERVKFIHIHGFHFSPRPGTAAARWTRDLVRGQIVNERINILTERAAEHSHAFRRQFVGETVEVLVERTNTPAQALRHGRCERYFDVHFEDATAEAGDLVRVEIEHVTATATAGRQLTLV